ncbi:MAG TPA: endolytic transglycosylase MltG [Patescibacteria group bacterium]|nr:endolytic transglycosylase MltG [Patescibacteria group bacterium]
MKKLLIVVILAVLLVVAGFMYWSRGNSAVNTKDKSTKVFVIKKGETVRQIGNELKSNGLIKDPVAFFIYIKLNGQDKNIQAGDYRLSPSMNLAKLVDTLNHGILDHWITIPEGLRADEIADIFSKELPSYNESWRAKLEENEGYLFPDTYLIPSDADADQVISIMRNNFDKRLKDAGITATGEELSNAVIIASIIEKEAKFAEDFPIVSSVIHNRLEDGMNLQVDPSVAYALGKQPNGSYWKAELTYDDLKINSPYNTYANAGLPPTAISNPGVQSIQAALNPSKTDYLYYISDKEGHIHAAKTGEGHNANIKKYL